MLIIVYVKWVLFSLNAYENGVPELLFFITKHRRSGKFPKNIVCIKIQVVDSKFVEIFVNTPKDTAGNKNDCADILNVPRIHSN